MAIPSCLRLFVHWIRRAASRAACTAGSSRAIRTAMIAITTSSSIRVNPARFRGVLIASSPDLDEVAPRVGYDRVASCHNRTATVIPDLRGRYKPVGDGHDHGATARVREPPAG